jgi:hypothetical protein
MQIQPLNLSGRHAKNEILIRFEFNRKKEETTFLGAQAAIDTAKNLFSNHPGTLEILSRTDDKRLTSMEEFPKSVAELEKYVEFGEIKKMKNKNVIMMFIKVLTEHSVKQIKAKMWEWLAANAVYIYPHNFKSRVLKDLGFLIMMKPSERFWPDVKQKLFNAIAETHRIIGGQSPDDVHPTELVPPIDITPRKVWSVPGSDTEKIHCDTMVVTTEYESHAFVAYLLSDTVLPEGMIFVEFGIQPALLYQQIQKQNKYCQELTHVPVIGLGADHLSSKVIPSDKISTEHHHKTFALGLAESLQDLSGNRILMSIERTHKTDSTGLVYFVCYEKDVKKVEEFIDNDLAAATQELCADYHCDEALCRFKTLPLRPQRSESRKNRAERNLSADPSIASGQYNAPSRNRQPRQNNNTRVLLDLSQFPELTATPTTNAWGISSISAQSASIQQNTSIATATQADTIQANNHAPNQETLLPARATGRNSPTNTQATSYVSDNEIMSQISSMHTDVTTTLASVASAFQIQAQESKASREAQQKFQQDLLIRSDRREERMSAQMKAIQESNQELVRLLVENRPSQNNATMGDNNQQSNNNQDNSDARAEQGVGTGRRGVRGPGRGGRTGRGGGRGRGGRNLEPTREEEVVDSTTKKPADTKRKAVEDKMEQSGDDSWGATSSNASFQDLDEREMAFDEIDKQAPDPLLNISVEMEDTNAVVGPTSHIATEDPDNGATRTNGLGSKV